MDEKQKLIRIVKELSEILGRDISRESQYDTVLELIDLYKKVGK